MSTHEGAFGPHRHDRPLREYAPAVDERKEPDRGHNGEYMDRIFTVVAGRVADLAGRPITFVIMLALIVLWGASGPAFGYSNTWQLIINTSTTIVTFLMVFLIQNSQNRDAAAMQAKLDELIRATESAREQFIGIEHLTDRQIQEIRAALEWDIADQPHRYAGKAGTVGSSVERLLARY